MRIRICIDALKSLYLLITDLEERRLENGEPQKKTKLLVSKDFSLIGHSLSRIISEELTLLTPELP